MTVLLEFRKIIQIGYRFDKPEVPPLLGPDGSTIEMVAQKWTGTFAFWVPVPVNKQVRGDGKTMVTDPFPHEAQALRDGALYEHVQEFEFEKEPTLAEKVHRLMQVWDYLVQEQMGAVHGVPVDTTTPLVMKLTSVTQEKGKCLPSNV